jgi:hypothetical protein
VRKRNHEPRVPVTLRFHPDLLAAWRKRAAAENRTLTAIVERALRAYLRVGGHREQA